MARLVLPSRLELKRREGSFREAPFAKVIFTTFLYASPVQIIPLCDQTGVPLHFHSSVTSASASLITQADPEMIEERKWRKPSNGMAGVPVWSHDGIVCTGETYKNVVKMTFAKGASLKDPSGLFNSSLEGNVRRAIDFHEGDKLDEKSLKALIRAAVALNKPSVGG